MSTESIEHDYPCSEQEKLFPFLWLLASDRRKRGGSRKPALGEDRIRERGEEGIRTAPPTPPGESPPGRTPESGEPRPAVRPSPVRVLLEAAGVLGIVAVVALLSFSRIGDDDVFWHLATGRWIAAHHTVPSADVFGYATQGETWIPFEWGWDLLAYAVNGAGPEFSPLLFLTAAIWSAVALLLFRIMRRRGVPLSVGIPAILFLLLASVERISPRPHVVTSLGLAVTASLCILYRDGGIRPKHFFAALAVVFLIWGNAHPGALAGLFLLGLFAAGDLIGALLGRGGGSDMKFRRGVSLAGAAAIAACVLLVNPHGVDTWRYLYSHTQMRMLAQIDEWVPPFSVASPTGSLLFYKILLAAGALTIVPLIRRRDPLPVLLAGGFALYSLEANRFVSDFALVNLVALSLSFEDLAQGAVKTFRRGADHPVAGGAAIVLLFFVAFSIPGNGLYKTLSYTKHFGAGIDPAYLPVPMIDYMKSRGIAGRPFNQYTIGGLLLWEFPGTQNFIDSRNLNDDIAARYVSIMHRQPGFERALDRYGVDMIALHLPDLPRSADALTETPALFCAAHRDEWKLVFWDDQSLLYVKSIPRFRPVIEADEYRILDPYLFAFRPQMYDSLRAALPGVYALESSRKYRDDPHGQIARYMMGK